MTLAQQLNDFQRQFRAGRSAETLAIMDQVTQDLQVADLVDRSLKTGDRVPLFQLPNATGETVDLGGLLAQGPVVLSFYRGGWCPYCNLELRALQQIQPQIRALGASLVAVSPQTPDNSLTTAEKHDLTFQVLSDMGNQIARQFGLVFTLPEELRSVYEGFGIDLPAHNGDQTFELPVAATYVIATDGTLVHGDVNVDYTQRMEPEQILEVLQQLPVIA